MKTGSSSIQYWLNENREALARAGVAVPASMSERNLSRLSRIAQGAASNEGIAAADRDWLDKLEAEIAALPAGIHSVVLSGETMGQRLVQDAQVAALKRVLDASFDSYRVIVYLRRQDRLSISRYSTALRHGSRRANPLLKSIDYEALLARWAAVFGKAAVAPRIFARGDLLGGDVVRDFAAIAGLPPPGSAEQPLDKNPSLRPEAQGVLSDLAALVHAAGHEGPYHELAGVQTIDRVLTARFSGPGTRPPRADAEAFYAPFRDANERVRRDWFPERERLFDEDFSDYPEAATPEPSAEAKLEAAMLALTALVLGSARSAGAAAAKVARRKERLGRQPDERPNRRPPAPGGADRR